MNDQLRRPWTPYAYAIAVAAIVTVALFRLPASLVVQIERNGPLSSSQAGWAVRLLLAGALAQAAFVSFGVLRIERLQRARDDDPELARTPPADLVRSLAGTSAVMSLLTLLYGLAAFAVTGERGSFWLWLILSAGQLAHSFRQTGEIAAWLAFQPDPAPLRIRSVLQGEPPDYVPPLARGFGDG